MSENISISTASEASAVLAFYLLDHIIPYKGYYLRGDGSVAKHNDKIIKLDHTEDRDSKGRRQYANLHIYRNGKNDHYPVHRLVYQLFNTVPTNFADMEVHHIDSNEHNNHPSNLYLLSPDDHKLWHNIKANIPDYKWENFLKLSEDDKKFFWVKHQLPTSIFLHRYTHADIKKMIG